MSKRFFVVVAAVTALCASSAWAYPTGIFGLGPFGCNACHSGGTDPTVTVQLPKTEVVGGETITATVTVTTPNGTLAGFNLTAASGTMSNPGPQVQVSGASATHTSPKSEDSNGNVTFTVDWTAPSTAGQVTFTAWGNSVNGNGLSSGDKAASDTETVTVCTMKWFPDGDSDGYGTGPGTVACFAPPGSATVGGDCNDGNANVHPNAAEVCDDIDNNCNGQVDEGVKMTWYQDNDLDGFGDPAHSVTDCMQPPNTSMVGTDCNDDDDLIRPGAMEVCDNQIDEDCTGKADDDVACGFDAGMDAGVDAGTDAGTDAGMTEDAGVSEDAGTSEDA
ncbi:MAG: putative metal-binding motif-containing protein, partial [Myxococcaceae bacterium]|nr:putative metal-binding motif-containing protein [Myxococcaceae bacterium]